MASSENPPLFTSYGSRGPSQRAGCSENSAPPRATLAVALTGLESPEVRHFRRLLFGCTATIVGAFARVLAYIFLRDSVRSLHAELLIARVRVPATSQNPRLLHALLAAEDHRFFFHRGIDPVAVLRALVRTATGHQQGGSSLEQQLIRTLTGDYRRCVRRKIREMLLASTVCEIYTKEEIAYVYLDIAYFGEGIAGSAAALQQIRLGGPCIASALVAHLKYPSPKSSSDKRAVRRLARTEYVAERMTTLTHWWPNSAHPARTTLTDVLRVPGTAE
jgi:hypothetical protein